MGLRSRYCEDIHFVKSITNTPAFLGAQFYLLELLQSELAGVHEYVVMIPQLKLGLF